MSEWFYDAVYRLKLNYGFSVLEIYELRLDEIEWLLAHIPPPE